MRVFYYLLPSEQGDDILLTESLVSEDSDLAILIEQSDENFPRWRIDATLSDLQGSTVNVSAADNMKVYWRRTYESFEGVLPFKTEDEAVRFGHTILAYISYLESVFDEE